MEAEDSTEVKNVGHTVLTLARALGVEKRVLTAESEHHGACGQE